MSQNNQDNSMTTSTETSGTPNQFPSAQQWSKPNVDAKPFAPNIPAAANTGQSNFNVNAGTYFPGQNQPASFTPFNYSGNNQPSFQPQQQSFQNSQSFQPQNAQQTPPSFPMNNGGGMNTLYNNQQQNQGYGNMGYNSQPSNQYQGGNSDYNNMGGGYQGQPPPNNMYGTGSQGGFNSNNNNTHAPPQQNAMTYNQNQNYGSYGNYGQNNGGSGQNVMSGSQGSFGSSNSGYQGGNMQNRQGSNKGFRDPTSNTQWKPKPKNIYPPQPPVAPQQNGFQNQNVNPNVSAQKKSSFSGFESKSFDPSKMSNYQQKNIPIKELPANFFSQLKAKSGIGLPSLPKIDKVTEACKKIDIKDAKEIEAIKQILTLFKDHNDGKEIVIPKKEKEDDKKDDNADDSKVTEKDGEAAKDANEKPSEKDKPSPVDTSIKKIRRKGALNLDVFMMVGDINLCSKDRTPEENKHCCNIVMCEREAVEFLELKKSGGYRDKRNDGQFINRNRGGKPQGPPRPKREETTPWIPKDNEDKLKLKKQAAEFHSRSKIEKTVEKKIQLILNVITPDNKKKKFDELKTYLFSDFRTRKQCFEEEVEYDEEVHMLTDENIHMEILKTVVENIIKKAQQEQLFSIFYGELCEDLINLELNLRDLDTKMSNLKHSLYRKYLFEVCKQCFEKFFDADEKKKQTKDIESTMAFEGKLFGNIEFVGELYRRKILPESTLISVFESLLGISETNEVADDLVIEGAVNLMNKVGMNFQQNVDSAKDNKKQEKLKNFNKIFGRFTELSDDKENEISKRVKLLIKNMFSNKKSGWLKTIEQNKSGPKTKNEVQKEVLLKVEKEQNQRNDRDDRRNNNYNDGGRQGGNNRDKHHNNRDRDRKDNMGYQEKNSNQKFQQKNRPGQTGGYGGGGPEKRDHNRDRRDGRNNNNNKFQDEKKEEKVVEYEAIDDQAMMNLVYKNFQKFCTDIQNASGPDDEAEEGSRTGKAQDKRPDYDVLKKLKDVNGKSGDQIVCQLLSACFVEDLKPVEEHLARYFECCYQDKILKDRDINKGLSRFSEPMSDLVLDCPVIHQYLMKHVIKPLQSLGIVQMKYVTWKVEEVKKEEDDDDYTSGTEPLFKLIALILTDLRKSKKSWQEVVAVFDKEYKWRSVVNDKHKDIENADQLWKDIQTEIGNEASSIIIPLLDEVSDKSSKQKQLQDALKKYK